MSRTTGSAWRLMYVICARSVLTSAAASVPTGEKETQTGFPERALGSLLFGSSAATSSLRKPPVLAEESTDVARTLQPDTKPSTSDETWQDLVRREQWLRHQELQLREAAQSSQRQIIFPRSGGIELSASKRGAPAQAEQDQNRTHQPSSPSLGASKASRKSSEWASSGSNSSLQSAPTGQPEREAAKLQDEDQQLRKERKKLQQDVGTANGLRRSKCSRVLEQACQHGAKHDCVCR